MKVKSVLASVVSEIFEYEAFQKILFIDASTDLRIIYVMKVKTLVLKLAQYTWHYILHSNYFAIIQTNSKTS